MQIPLVLQGFLHLEPSRNGSDPDLVRSGLFKIMLPTAAGSIFSIFNPLHVDANALHSCLGRDMGLSKFALQLSSWARAANTHGNIGCAFYASTAAQTTPEHVKEAQNPSKSRPDSATISPDQDITISDQSKPSQDQVKNCSNQQISSQFRPPPSVGRS